MSKAFSIHRGWLVVLATTLVAAWFAPKKQDDGVVLAEKSSRSSAGHASASSVAGGAKHGSSSSVNLQVLKIRERQSSMQGGGVFAVTSWSSPRVVETASARAAQPQSQPASPVAPPLPFRIMGSYTEDGHTAVFLLQADQSWVAHEGDVISDSYKVERIAANAIHFRYLPLGEVQVLEFGSVQGN